MSKSMVRLALEGSVAWTAPPVSFHSSQLSMVPTATSGPSATPPSVRSHSTFDPLK